MSLPATKALDLSLFPLVVLALPPKIDPAFAEILEQDHKALFATRSRYVSIADTTRVVGMPDARARQRMAEWAKAQEDTLRRYQVANAMLVPNAVIRAGLSAIHWFAPPPVPTAIETEHAPALEFLRRHAQSAGLSTLGVEAYARRCSVRLAAS